MLLYGHSDLTCFLDKQIINIYVYERKMDSLRHGNGSVRCL